MADMEKTARLLASNPKLMKAALAGMEEGLKTEAAGQHIQIDPAFLQELGRMPQAPTRPGGSKEDNFVVKAVSDVFAVVKVDILTVARQLEELARVNQNAKVIELANQIQTQLQEGSR